MHRWKKRDGIIFKPEEGESITQAVVTAMQRRITALEMECEILKKPQPYSPKRRNNVLGFAFESKSYYKASKRKPTKTQVSNDELDSKILKVYYESKRHNGAPMIFKAIRNEGEAASLKRSQRRMAVLRIKSVVVKK